LNGNAEGEFNESRERGLNEPQRGGLTSSVFSERLNDPAFGGINLNEGNARLNG
jgi:hypothetical protein